MSEAHFDITWQATGLPDAPTGAQVGPAIGPALDFSGGFPVTRTVALPWAAGVGCYVAFCRVCARRAVCTTTGAGSDPISVMVQCARAPGGQQYAVADDGRLA
jgi:hypothetical protein